ncbi:MAG: disulfide bond formation protein B [Novosphingobium sp.]
MNKGADNLACARWLALVVPVLLLGGAYIGQYAFGLYPCEMCWWQRYPHFVAIVLAALAFVTPLQRLFVWLAALSIMTSGAIGAFHAGVEYGWWEGLTTCATPGLGNGDPLDAVFNAPLVRCDDVQWSLFGISLAGWNFLVSTVSFAVIARLLLRNGHDRA